MRFQATSGDGCMQTCREHLLYNVNRGRST